jgi:hypothetical protein
MIAENNSHATVTRQVSIVNESHIFSPGINVNSIKENTFVQPCFNFDSPLAISSFEDDFELVRLVGEELTNAAAILNAQIIDRDLDGIKKTSQGIYDLAACVELTSLAHIAMQFQHLSLYHRGVLDVLLTRIRKEINLLVTSS